ncbi:zinc ribbon domain-containing protein [Baekduia sp. Peel2402]|uniref:zinc ribbon domain-containing protein n=1 Tax=Baekduia sp. Peel2402 TaxID=3458296 RepID=UPI00403E36B5
MFCPHCGAKTEPDAAFCEACGTRLTEGTAPAAPPTPPSGSPSGLLVGGGVLLVAAVVVGVLALTGVIGGHAEVARVELPARPTVTAPPPMPAPATVETVPEPETTTETEPEPDAEPEEPRSVAATVARTCGRGGVGGDCHLSVRASPSSDSAELRRLDEGDALRLSCQLRGDPVRSSALGVTSSVWSRTTQGGYVTNVYVKGPGLKSRSITLRRC